MNILFLSELFYPHGSGGELATYLYAKLLSKADFNVIVVTNRFAGEKEVSKEGNLIVYRLPLLKGSESVKYEILKRFNVLFSSFMKKIMRWADVVYIPRFWYSAIPLAKAYGKPIITHLHDYIPICPLAVLYNIPKSEPCNFNGLLCSVRCIYVYERSQMRRLIETLMSSGLNFSVGRLLGKMVALSDAIICVSHAQKNIIVNKLPFLKEKIHVIYNPIPDLHETEIQGNDFGYFGGPNPLKGFYVLLRALNHPNQKQIKVHATNFNSKESWSIISQHYTNVILYPRLTGNLYEKLYKEIRAVVVPSISHEPSPYVVAEAILRRRLVVASAVGGIPELVEDCKGVFLFERGNFRELAERLKHISELSKETVEDLGSNNKEVLTQKLSNEASLRNFIALCNRVLSG